MTNKTMPDVIYLQPNAGIDGETTWCDGSQFDDDVEYVRADLASNPDAKNSEEWEEGEFRWVKIDSKDNPWELAQAYYDPLMSQDMKVSVDNSLFDISEVAEFGPVIQPPKDI